VQPYPKAPGRKETVKGRKTGKFQILTVTQEKKNWDQTRAEGTKRLKMLRCEEGLSKKDNIWKGHSRKTLSDEDLDTSCQNISAEKCK